MSKLRDKRLYWRGGRIWCRVPDASGHIVRRTTKCRDEAAASRFADELERRYADPSYAASAATTLEGSLKAYFADLVRRGRSDATKKIAEQKCGHFIRIWGREMPMASITARLVLEYIDKRQREDVSDFTIKKELGHLGQVLKIARHIGTFPLDPERVMPPFFSGGHKPRTRAPSIEEVTRLLDELEDRRAAHLAFIVATGARLGESFRARRSDVDEARRVVTLRGTKTKAAAAEVPITPVTSTLLEWSLANAPGRDVLFHPWGKLHRDVEAACVRAGIAKVTPNDLRRAMATWHRQRGIDPTTVSKLLRHTTDKLAQTTYANIGAEDIGRIVEARLLPAPETVPILYPSGAQSVVSGANVNGAIDAEGSKKPDSAGAPETNRTSDQRFRKPEHGRRSRGTILGLARKNRAAGVPILYPVAPWVHEATGNLLELLDRAADGAS